MDEPKIVYEDENFVGISKPAGMLVHPYTVSGKWSRPAGSREARQMANGEKTLVSWLLEKYPEMKTVGDPSTRSTNSGQASSGQANLRPGIVHRLDRETSGIMLAVRNQKYFDYFKSLFKERQIKKTYLALVSGEPKEKHGVIDKPIGIKNGSIKRSIHSGKMLKSAVTEYKVIKTFYGEPFNHAQDKPGRTIISGVGPFSLLEVFPKTGRTHQIRVHLASIGHPIVGDPLYGGKKNAGLAKRLMLHAYSLEFSLPNGRRLKLEAEPEEPFPGFEG
ncbi:MAG: RluA family pseudouridine synthase [bacterium]|nr:RluA family pseudouridine synthase [bacterium]